ncbi:DUF4870 domain-containing protein [Ktedonobacter sp. SOSP1-85]|uniref:DUF4870 domain-containing protein n=1 Tax=Ktedonobacter sp. SOSP1-85 TaxID=2778367 RepID=UPI0019162487|nr:hypothetical protein [Ktedonobacter sp. SOSP1-85]
MSYYDPNQQPDPEYGSGNPPQQGSSPYRGKQARGNDQPNPQQYEQQRYQQPERSYQQPERSYQQPGQGYQQPYGQPGYGQAVYGPPSIDEPMTIKMRPNIAAGLAALFGWVGGLIFLFIEKQNHFVRFYAMQALLFGVAGFILGLVDRLIGGSGLFGAVLSLISVAFFVGWIITFVNAFQGKYFKLPVVGNMAEKYINTGSF